MMVTQNWQDFQLSSLRVGGASSHLNLKTSHLPLRNYLFLIKIHEICSLCMGALPVCMYVHHVLEVPMEGKRGCQIPWKWNYRQLWAAAQMLGIKPGSSRRESPVLLPAEPLLLTPPPAFCCYSLFSLATLFIFSFLSFNALLFWGGGGRTLCFLHRSSLMTQHLSSSMSAQLMRVMTVSILLHTVLWTEYCLT